MEEEMKEELEKGAGQRRKKGAFPELHGLDSVRSEKEHQRGCRD